MTKDDRNTPELQLGTNPPLGKTAGEPTPIDRERFNRILEDSIHPWNCYALSIVENENDAANVVSECSIKYLDRVVTFHKKGLSDAKICRYMSLCVYTTSIDLLKRRTRDRSQLHADVGESLDALGKNVRHPSVIQWCASRKNRFALRRQYFAEEFEKLDPDEQQLIWKMYVEKLTYDQLVRSGMGRRSTLQAAVAKIKKKLIAAVERRLRDFDGLA